MASFRCDATIRLLSGTKRTRAVSPIAGPASENLHDLCFPQSDFSDRMVGTLVQHNVGPRPRRLNVLPEIGAVMLTPQPVRNLACAVDHADLARNTKCVTDEMIKDLFVPGQAAVVAGCFARQLRVAGIMAGRSSPRCCAAPIHPTAAADELSKGAGPSDSSFTPSSQDV
jgi:hypothetical protein